MEELLKEVWARHLSCLGWGISGTHQGEVNGVSQVDGDMAPACACQQGMEKTSKGTTSVNTLSERKLPL